ncbi:methylenetetrahydrofolate reductase [Celeribacter indicus]|uniref:Methylenetetrahydrofolate reductase n=1 Tax=Celeribacter indicus TaxID=1208324 RepID=A0A0B5E0C9_9RHOB|nr:methylenetetrahydrofolate reductase [Celeribacter indicus]AJE48684.1 5,10-methylenetetrahydrofolate reductase [Celeribacter indicus]SDX35701.1 methylenetetrahydrofolate reductase (NADPH) [Celeribacter indicus]
MPEASLSVLPARLIDGDISLELPPDAVDKFRPDAKVLSPGAKVFLPHLEGKPPEQQVAAAKALIDMGYTPVVHLGARHFATEADFVRHLEAHSANGVTHALFLGGNPARYSGPFGQALDLLHHPSLHDSGIRRAFLGGYPEGHPDISEDRLDAALSAKIDRCHDIGLAPEVVTQFAFDGEVLAGFAWRMQARHPDVPVRLGLAGVTSLPKLIRYAIMCGVGPSLSVLKKSSGKLLGVLADKDPSDVANVIEQRITDHDGRVELHFFPFGGWQKTLDWLQRYRETP